jgi:NTE family protein
MKKIGLALGGGGARGLCEVVFIQALDELNIRPSVISGTSMGAIIGAFYASGMSGAEMENLVRKIGLIDLGKMVDFKLFSKSALLRGHGVEEFLQERIPFETFEELEIPLKIVTTNFWDRRQVVVDSGPLMPAIRSSISLPAIFEPVSTEGAVLIDGGAVNPLPYDIIRESCDILIAIDVSGVKTPREKSPIPNMFESIMSTFEIMQASIVENKMKISHPDIYLKPSLENIQILEFNRYAEILKRARSHVDPFKKEMRRHLQIRTERNH